MLKFNLQKNILSILDEQENNEKERDKKTGSKLKDIKEAIDLLDKNLSSAYANLNSLIIGMQRSIETEQSELYVALLETEEYLADSITQNMDQTKLIFESLMLMMKQDFEKTRENIKADMNGVEIILSSVHNQIIDTQNNINSLLHTLDDNSEIRQQKIIDRMDKIKLDIQGVNDSLLKIEADMQTAHEELKAFMLKIQESADENNKVLLGVLRTMEEDMQLQSGKNMSQIMDSFSVMSNNFISETEKLQNLMTDFEVIWVIN